MPKICYQSCKFSDATLALIAKLDAICHDYTRQGYSLTVRQLHYKVFLDYPDDRRWTWNGSTWVRDPNGTKNAQPNYKWLINILARARMAGLIDWDHIVDRTRNLMGNRHWDKPSTTIKESAEQYAIDKWETQDHFVSVWMEKEAMEDIVGQICTELDVPFFACRGYTSLSSMWAGSRVLLSQLQKNKTIHIIHLGDHDPSGLDMSRDIKERLDTFINAHMPGERVHVLRVALNMPQITRLSLPPSPTKGGDSRTPEYAEKYGEDCWELDALEPAEIRSIVDRAVRHYRDDGRWNESIERERKGRNTLEEIYQQFPDVVKFLRGEL